MDSVVKTFPQYAEIFKEGDIGDAAYILTQGRVEISVAEEKRQRVLTVLEPISVFGEMAMLSKDMHRTATARALELTKVAVITKDQLYEYINQSPKFITAVLTALVDRLRQTTTQVLSSHDIFLSVCELLSMLCEHDVKCFRPDVLVPRVSRMLGVKQAEIAHVFETMENMNLIEFVFDEGEKRLMVPDPHTLLERAHKIHEAILVLIRK